MSIFRDTIAAISTPAGVGAIAIVRVSGETALEAADRIFESAGNKKIADTPGHRVLYGRIKSIETGRIIDEVLVTVMRAPHSYTGENTVEISTHGGIKTPVSVLEELYKAGARPAAPGEFTKRAFLNGKLDLSQAEAVIDLINSKTTLSSDYALEHLRGRLSRRIDGLREELLTLQSHIMAFVDFPEEDIDEITLDRVKIRLESISGDMTRLLSTADFGQLVQEGVKTTIAGKPNVGKSSLLNALLGQERAIVTEVAGTTRDVVTAVADVRGIPLLISDTAGIRKTEDLVEKMGTERSRAAIESAQLVLLVMDLSREADDMDSEIIELCNDKKVILVLNKEDLPQRLDLDKLPAWNRVMLSAKDENGIDKLHDAIFDTVSGGSIGENEEVITNARHKTALYLAREAVDNAAAAIEGGMPFDMISIDIQTATEELGGIVGKAVSEEVVDRIFSRFCLGK